MRRFERDSAGLKGLLPTVHAALARNEVATEGRWATYLRAARVREELRVEIVRQIRDAALDALAGIDVQVLPAGSCVLIETVYPTPTERHCHGMEFVVRGEDLARAARALRDLGFGPASAGADGRLLLHHRNGLELALDRRWNPDPSLDEPWAAAWDRSVPRALPGARARVLSPGDELLRVLARAALSPARANLRWALDARRIVDTHTGLDWEVLATSGSAPPTALYLSPMLDYVAGELEASVPRPPRAALAAGAGRADLRQREAAFLRSTFRLGSAIRALSREPDRGIRTEGLRFVALPSRAWLRERYPRVPGWAGPALYLYRPLRYAALTARARLRRGRGE